MLVRTLPNIAADVNVIPRFVLKFAIANTQEAAKMLLLEQFRRQLEPSHCFPAPQ